MKEIIKKYSMILRHVAKHKITHSKKYNIYNTK